MGVSASQSVQRASSIQPIRECRHRYFCGRVLEVLHSAPHRWGWRSEDAEDHADVTEGVLRETLLSSLSLFFALFNLLDLFVAASPAGESSGQSLLAEWSSVPHGHGNALVLGEQGRLTWRRCQPQQGCFSGASGRLLEGASNIVCALRQHPGSRSATFGGNGHFAAGGSHCASVNNVLFQNIYFTFYLQVMSHPEIGNKRHPQKKKSVRICLEKENDSENTEIPEGSVEKTAHTLLEPVKEPAFGSLKTPHLEDLVCQLVQLCLMHVNDNKSETHLVFLSLLLRSFHTPRVFRVRPAIISFHKSVPLQSNMRPVLILLIPAVCRRWWMIN